MSIFDTLPDKNEDLPRIWKLIEDVAKSAGLKGQRLGPLLMLDIHDEKLNYGEKIFVRLKGRQPNGKWIIEFIASPIPLPEDAGKIGWHSFQLMKLNANMPLSSWVIEDLEGQLCFNVFSSIFEQCLSADEFTFCVRACLMAKKIFLDSLK